MDKKAILNNVKILLDIENDTSQDGLLNLLISRSINYTMNYLRIEEIPNALQSVIEEMVVFNYRQRDVENIKSEGKGSLSESYITEYPSNIMNQLNPHRRVKVI